MNATKSVVYVNVHEHTTPKKECNKPFAHEK